MVVTNGIEFINTNKFRFRIKLGDFGSAKKIDGFATCNTSSGFSTGGLGTLRWAAPESTQAVEFRGVPTRLDVFSFGCVTVPANHA